MKILQDRFEKLADTSTKTDIFYTIAELAKNGAKCYLVGGCVRDLLLDIKPKDFDIEVYGISSDSFDQVMQNIGAIGVGKSFFVYKYNNIDISLPRGEKKVSNGHTGFSVYVEQDMRKACQRRDFTINAMLLDANNFEIFDFFGGLADLNSKTLRLVDKSSFADDSLRVLRAMRLSGQLGFRIDSNTVSICQNISIADLSNERIYMEFEKLFLSKYIHFGLFFAFKLGVMEKIFGLSSNRQEFFLAARLALKVQNSMCTSHELLFLFAIAQVFRMSLVKLITRVAPPNRMIKDASLQKRIPKTITARYLAGLSTRLAIKEWLGSYDGKVATCAKALQVWDTKFEPKTTSHDAIALGLNGKDVGIYLRAQRAKEIRENFSKEKI